MSNTQNINTPSADVAFAFTMTGPVADVARIERLAANRMARVRGWVGWRISNVDVEEADDGLAKITISADPVGPGYREPASFTFLTDGTASRGSNRFNALLAGCGVREHVDDTREVEGRYFAARNYGRVAADFGPLTLALLA
jgi:hypothetical protein